MGKKPPALEKIEGRNMRKMCDEHERRERTAAYSVYSVVCVATHNKIAIAITIL
jgi:hypothetical protein